MDPRSQPFHHGIHRPRFPEEKAAVFYDRTMDMFRNVERLKRQDKKFTIRETLRAESEVRDEKRKFVIDRVKHFELLYFHNYLT